MPRHCEERHAAVKFEWLKHITGSTLSMMSRWWRLHEMGPSGCTDARLSKYSAQWRLVLPQNSNRLIKLGVKLGALFFLCHLRRSRTPQPKQVAHICDETGLPVGVDREAGYLTLLNHE